MSKYTTSQMRSDLYHFAGYTTYDLYEATSDEIKNLWNHHFNNTKNQK